MDLNENYINNIIHGDSIKLIKNIESESVHLILSDIPYGISMDKWDVLHNNKNSALLGSSPAQKVAGKIFKKRGKPINGWSEADKNIPKEYQDWCNSWAKDWFRVLKHGGNVFIFAGRRLSHRCACAMEDAGFNLKDTLSWIRSRAPHRAQRLSIVYNKRGDSESAQEWDGWRVGNLRPIFEPIMWFTKPYKIGTTIADNVLEHGIGAYNQNAFLKYANEPNNLIEAAFIKKEGGLHPTQKPIQLMKALIELTTKEGQIVLDPFAGSGTTLLAAKELNRKYLGFEQDEEYTRTALERLNSFFV